MGMSSGRVLVLIMTSMVKAHTLTSVHHVLPSKDPVNNCSMRSECRLQPLLTDIRYQNCACDGTCSIYDDCCGDASSNPHAPLKVVPSCKKIISIDWSRSVYIVDSCPREYPRGETKQRCENPAALPMTSSDLFFDHVPVSGQTSGVLYANAFCALCNDDFFFDFWQVNISQKVEFPPEMFENSTDLAEMYAVALTQRGGVIYQSDLHQARTCKSEVSICEETWSDNDIRIQCQDGYMSRVFRVVTGQEVVTFRNIECAICNDVPLSSLQCEDPSDDPLSPPKPPYRPMPFSILLDVNRGAASGGKHSNQVGYVYKKLPAECQPGYIYNPMNGNCESFVCEAAEYSESGEAEQVMETCGSLSGPWYNFSDVNGTDYELVWKFDQVQGYLTIIGNTLSACGLVAQLTVYTLLPTLRNTPGKCLMCLSASLLTSQILFLLASPLAGVSGICSIIALLMHYGFLAYFFWMSVMAFDVWRAFTSAPASGSSSPKKRFVRYSIYSWASSAVIVLLALCVDFTESPWRPNFADGICWFGNRSGLIVFFAIPLAIIVILNAILFVLTVHAIHDAAESAKMATSSNEKSRLWLYVKLASIMGLTWIFGFLAALTDYVAMWYLFIILNSSQGLFICITFCCTKKVLRLLADKFHKGSAKNTATTCSIPSTKQTELSVRNNTLHGKVSVVPATKLTCTQENRI